MIAITPDERGVQIGAHSVTFLELERIIARIHGVAVALLKG